MVLEKEKIIALDTELPVWDHFFTVAPLVVIGTKEGEGYDLAPKHMVTPLGQGNYFGFVCTPRHSTYHNVQREGRFTVSFPRPEQVVLASLAASPRCGREGSEKPVVGALPVIDAPNTDAPFLQQGYLFFECDHLKTIDGFGEHSLICGKITGAYVHEDYQRLTGQDEQDMVFKAPLLAYLAGGRFATIKESLTFPYPKDFKH